MTSIYLLVTIMRFTVGIQEPVSFVGGWHETMEGCMRGGQEMVGWLSQDFVQIDVQCQPYTQEAYARRMIETWKQGS